MEQCKSLCMATGLQCQSINYHNDSRCEINGAIWGNPGVMELNENALANYYYYCINEGRWTWNVSGVDAKNCQSDKLVVSWDVETCHNDTQKMPGSILTSANASWLNRWELTNNKSMAEHKTAVTRAGWPWSYDSLVLNNRNSNRIWWNMKCVSTHHLKHQGHHIFRNIIVDGWQADICRHPNKGKAVRAATFLI